jgi:hypothetical protein
MSVTRGQLRIVSIYQIMRINFSKRRWYFRLSHLAGNLIDFNTQMDFLLKVFAHVS